VGEQGHRGLAIILVMLVDQVEGLNQNTPQELIQDRLERQDKVIREVTVALTLMVNFTIQGVAVERVR
jgi:hypothetical protein